MGIQSLYRDTDPCIQILLADRGASGYDSSNKCDGGENAAS